MGILMPVNKEFLDSKGDDYGQGTNPSSILYCGPYLIKAITSKSVVTLEKNPTYWDADNVKISKVKLTYYDGQDSESLIRGFDNGDYTFARVFPNGSNYKSVEKKHKMTLSSVTKDPLLITCLSTLTVKLMRLRLKLQMLKRAQPRKQS